MSNDQRRPIMNALSESLGEQASRVERDLDDVYGWMRTKGKNPNRRKPLSPSVSSNYHSRIDQVFRFVIDRNAPADNTTLAHEQADLIIKLLDRNEICKRNGDPYSESGKRKFADAIPKYFAWRYDRLDDVERWRPRINFSEDLVSNSIRLERRI